MDARNSSEEEEEKKNEDIAVEVRNAEGVVSPVSSTSEDKKAGASNMRRGSRGSLRNGKDDAKLVEDVLSPRVANFRRFSQPANSFEKEIGGDSETSDSEDSDDMDIQKNIRPKDFYDTKQFEDMEVSAEVRELFQNIIRYTPQPIELQYKLIPFIPDYIPAVGDIDAFLKIPRPDGKPDTIGLTVLDEPAAEQSEPAVLHLQLRSKIRSATGASKQPSLVKRLEDASKQSKMIVKWIEDMSQLHRSQPPPAVQIVNKFPDIESLLQPWPPEIEDKLHLGTPANFDRLDCSLFQLIDLICALVDIPIYGNARIESLHILFTLYTEVHNVDIQTIHNS